MRSELVSTDSSKEMIHNLVLKIEKPKNNLTPDEIAELLKGGRNYIKEQKQRTPVSGIHPSPSQEIIIAGYLNPKKEGFLSRILEAHKVSGRQILKPKK